LNIIWPVQVGAARGDVENAQEDELKDLSPSGKKTEEDVV
jgi:hypothetical protein